MSQIDFLAGCYSGGGPEGVQRIRLDTASGELTALGGVPGAPDASWLAFGKDRSRLYAVDEATGRLGAFQLSPDASAITPLGYQPTGAGLPCHLALSPEGTHIVAANYGAGRATLFAIDPATGTLTGETQYLEGTQSTAEGHAHWAGWSPDGRFLHVVDLGHDEVRAYRWQDGKAGPPITSFKMPKGAGPRHLAFHKSGRFAYLLTEYGNTLTALRVGGDGRLTEIETRSTLPPGYAEKSFGAHIQIVGDTVYVSNRGHNSIAAFRIAADGRISLSQIVPTGGNWPRFFIVIDGILIVANQLSDEFTLFTVAAGGRIGATGKRLPLGKPVMLLPL